MQFGILSRVVLVVVMGALALPGPGRAQVDLGDPPTAPRDVSGLPGRMRKQVVTPGLSVNTSSREEMRSFYNGVYAASSGVPINSTSVVSSCVPGANAAAYQDAVVRRINWFRAAAGVPASISLDNGDCTNDQAAALMMSANGALSHFPPPSWSCYTSSGANAASNSNLAIGNAGPDAITAFICDYGANNSEVGHRRWILYPQTQIMGTGDIPAQGNYYAANATWVMDANLFGPRPATAQPFVAWPPPGFIPWQLVFPRWSFALSNADLSTANVIMTSNGVSVPINYETNQTGFGENTIVWVPDNLDATSAGTVFPFSGTDTVYSIVVTNIKFGLTTTGFAYTVTLFDPSVPGADYVPTAISGPAQPVVGFPTNYTCAPPNNPHVTGYQWVVAQAPSGNLFDGAENGASNFIVAVTPGYSVITNGRAASGYFSFYLAMTNNAADQILQLNRILLPATNTSVSFAGLLGYASSNQVAEVQISTTGGLSWQNIYSQAGTNGLMELSYHTHSLSLSNYAGQPVLLRFNYHLAPNPDGTYVTYPPSVSPPAGWFIDNILITNTLQLTNFSTNATASPNFVFTPALSQGYILQAQPMIFNQFPIGFGPLAQVTAIPPPATGSLQVTITPSNAVSAGAQWQVNGGAFRAGGAIVTNLSPTNYTVSFKAIPGWTSPSSQTVTIAAGQTTTLVASYIDATKPTLAITSPTANQRWSNSTITVTGTATDNVAVASVYCQLNGGSWTTATPGSPNPWTNWTANVILSPGTNVVQAYSQDTSGNCSPTNKVTFLFIPSATLIVQTNGNGGITPVANGKMLAIGTNYTLTASPGKNSLFSNWVGGTTFPWSVLSSSSNCTFAMQSNLVLAANFVTNPFLGVAGVYNGLFYPASGVAEASSGFISAAIASNGTGAYTAKLLLDGGSNSFSGSFDLTGTARTNLVRNGKTPVSVTLMLDFNPADALLGGSVSNAAAGWNAVIQADRAVFSASGNPATNYAGQFTLLLPPGSNAPVGSPDGYGYAAITNTLDGVSTLGGALADGTPFLWSAPIARDGGVPLYQSLYSGKGSLLGWIHFTNAPPQHVSANSSVSWIKPSVPGTLYPSGFTNLTGVLGSPYTNTGKAGVPVLNLTSATLILTNGNLTGGFLIYTNIGTNLSSHNTLTNLDAGNPHPSPTNRLVIAINTNNGLVTVTFQPTGAKTNTVAHGAVLQNQTNAAGYFLATNQSGAFILMPR